MRNAVVLLLIYGKLDAPSSPWQLEEDLGGISSWILSEKINPWRIFRLWEEDKLIWYASSIISLLPSLPPARSLSLSLSLSFCTVINDNCYLTRLVSKVEVTCTLPFLMSHWRNCSMVVFVITLRADSPLKTVSTIWSWLELHTWMSNIEVRLSTPLDVSAA